MRHQNLIASMIACFFLYGVVAGASLRIAHDNQHQSYEVDDLLKMSLAELGELRTAPRT